MMRLSSTIPCGKYKHPDLPNFLNHKPLYFSSPYLKGSTLLILPTPYLQHSRIIKNAIGRSGRYLNFSSQRRRKILSTAASETERKRPDDAFFNDETVLYYSVWEVYDPYFLFT